MAEAVRVEGLRHTVRSLEKLGVEVDDLKDVFSDIAKVWAEAAKKHAPVRTGQLRKSIRGNRAKNRAVVIAGKARVPYAGPINYGWPSRNIRPSEFLQQADEELRDYAINRLNSGLGEAIRKAELQ